MKKISRDIYKSRSYTLIHLWIYIISRILLVSKVTKQPNGESIMAALNDAIKATNSCQYRRTFHSDQGWAYQMRAYGEELNDNKIFQEDMSP